MVVPSRPSGTWSLVRGKRIIRDWNNSFAFCRKFKVGISYDAFVFKLFNPCFEFKPFAKRQQLAFVGLLVREFMWTDLHRSEEIIQVGERSAEEAIPQLKALLPYFSDHCKVPLGVSLRAY